MKVTGKELQPAQRGLERQRKTEQIDQNVNEIKNIWRIRDIHNHFRNHAAYQRRRQVRQCAFEQSKTSSTYSLFYEELCKAREERGVEGNEERCWVTNLEIPSVTLEEIEQNVRRLKRGKAADARGIAAEMFEVGGLHLKEVLAGVFTWILVNGDEPPESWRRNRVKVIFKRETRSSRGIIVPSRYCRLCTNSSQWFSMDALTRFWKASNARA